MARIVGSINLVNHPGTGEKIKDDSAINLRIAQAKAADDERKAKKASTEREREKRNREGLKSAMWAYLDRNTIRKLNKMGK